MSEKSSPGWIGITTSGLVLLAAPSLAQWLFPSWDAFFAAGAGFFAGVWRFMTAQWSVPAVPLVAVVLAAVAWIWRLARPIAPPRMGSKIASSEGAERIASIREPQGAVTINIPGRGPVQAQPVGGPNPPKFTPAEASILNLLLHTSSDYLPGNKVEQEVPHPAIIVRDASDSLVRKGMIKVTTGNLRGHSLTDEGKAVLIKAYSGRAPG